MKKLLIACTALALTGCGDNHSEFNGVYICKIGQIVNSEVVKQGSEYSFPLVAVKTKMTFKNGVMTIHGMKSGDYVGHEMALTAAPVTPDGRKIMSEREFQYDDGEFSESFFPKYAIATLSVGSPRDGIMQQLTNCKKEQ
ncbi:hypothetical protein Xvie_03472 [Xenorhabdus vietnamensis]|uniref:Lipoprotein n=1 Tax=Xenorhabdus vietnamensis TaxID=351656 RepID=A0A1Y2S803_9GAMM|nr:hypothetical protein [Xenorhabdus vietnamensis]OTA14768.1 hypothetical protein Xvie_03472 [Xenorhabdus vietnamensis]